MAKVDLLRMRAGPKVDKPISVASSQCVTRLPAAQISLDVESYVDTVDQLLRSEWFSKQADCADRRRMIVDVDV